MAVMSKEVQDLLTNVKGIAFATANADGQPNCCVVGMKKVVDAETVYLSDQFFNKTLANVKENQKVSLMFWEGHDAFQIYGTARYVNEGEEFASQKEWVDALFAQMGMPIKAKGGIYVHVDAVYNTAAGPNAGAQIA
ncbi:MAG: pyridoxamine 5'-phosphate oxidase family protein [Eggerthellaceae bacterium]|nr:pyridoxamine 5'-phosphate oxidase family protein [Eggerthellaceae bacterium]